MLPDATANSWLQDLQKNEFEHLKVPSGNTYRVSRVLGFDNNEYVVLEGDYANGSRKLETPTGKTFNVITGEGDSPMQKEMSIER